MKRQTQNLLISAWRENRLAAVHIDLQNMYADGNEMVFRSVGLFARHLRAHSIANTWVAYPKIEDDSSCHVPEGLTTVRDFNRFALHRDHGNGSLLSPLVQANPLEKTVIKHWGSAFNDGEDSNLFQHLERGGKDTILIDGVSSYACVARTLLDGVSLDRFDFIVVEDCINLPETMDMEYRDSLINFARNPDALLRRFHNATAAGVIDTLETHANPVRRSITSSHHRIPIGAQSFAL